MSHFFFEKITYFFIVTTTLMYLSCITCMLVAYKNKFRNLHFFLVVVNTTLPFVLLYTSRVGFILIPIESNINNTNLFNSCLCFRFIRIGKV